MFSPNLGGGGFPASWLVAKPQLDATKRFPVLRLNLISTPTQGLIFIFFVMRLSGAVEIVTFTFWF